MKQKILQLKSKIFRRRSVKKKIIRLSLTCLYRLNYVFPKKNNLWLISAWFGERYSDNSQYLFEYVLQNQPGIKIFWITKNSEVYSYLRKQNKPVIYAYSVKAIWFLLRAKVYIFSSNLNDVTWFGAGKNTFCLQLWHGSPLKKIVCDNPIEWQRWQSEDYLRHITLYPYDREHCDAVITPSNYFQEIFRSAFRLQSQHFPIVGFPRVDRLLSGVKPYSTHAPKLLYAPTFRGTRSEVRAVVEYGQFFSLNQLFQRYHAHMEIQYHPVDDVTPKVQGFSHISELLPQDDFYTYLQEIDILITDYSGLIFDFLLTGKPVICVASDIDTYVTQDRPLYRHPSEVPGLHVCYTWDEVYELLEKIFQGVPGIKKELTKEQLSDLYAFEDCNASQRITDYIKKSIGEARF